MIIPFLVVHQIDTEAPHEAKIALVRTDRLLHVCPTKGNPAPGAQCALIVRHEFESSQSRVILVRESQIDIAKLLADTDGCSVSKILP